MQNEFSNQCSNKVLNSCKMILILVKSFKNKVFLKLVTGLTAKLTKVYAKSAKFFLCGFFNLSIPMFVGSEGAKFFVSRRFGRFFLFVKFDSCGFVEFVGSLTAKAAKFFLNLAKARRRKVFCFVEFVMNLIAKFAKIF